MHTEQVLLLLASTAAARTISTTLARRDAAVNWTYTGCYRDNVSARTLAYASHKDFAVQTVETCTTWCAANNFNICGLEYGSECYGDYSLPGGAEAAPETDCSMTCAGNSSQICGGGSRLSVYASGKAGTGPVTNPGPNGWGFLACYSDAGSGKRTLSTPQSVDAGSWGMTVAGCAAACRAGGYRFAGVEYADE